ncbi:hypothetical protein INT48_004331 [Thamnidium elegans]|uniref:Uncharacterized protein n=1 Tax=Thamnidium elegans TaxID=101142 RepID=A0A8H7VVH4_9FUNG|nr:hypothetical protein INT48_004331 [Thamnidium elegans]
MLVINIRRTLDLYYLLIVYYIFSTSVLASTIITPAGCRLTVGKIKSRFSFMKDRLKQKHYADGRLSDNSTCLKKLNPVVMVQAEEARQLFRSFCKRYSSLFEPELIEPSFNYAIRLYDNIEQYGKTSVSVKKMQHKRLSKMGSISQNVILENQDRPDRSVETKVDFDL